VSSTSFVGYANSASNNSVLVSGAGSVWSIRNELTLGSNSPGNRIEVRDGARVFVNGSTFMGRGGLSRSNSILVTGAGTVWTNAGGSTFSVGRLGSELVVSDGARMHASSWNLGGFNSGNCEAMITGPGTLLDCVTAALDLDGNRMRISDGAMFQAGSAYADNGGSLNTGAATS
jgi:T5SS/PEP-CTERM-associated repeat protein